MVKIKTLFAAQTIATSPSEDNFINNVITFSQPVGELVKISMGKQSMEEKIIIERMGAKMAKSVGKKWMNQ